MDSSEVKVKKDVINEAIELFNVLRKNRKKSVNEVKVKKELMNDSFNVQNSTEEKVRYFQKKILGVFKTPKKANKFFLKDICL